MKRALLSFIAIAVIILSACSESSLPVKKEETAMSANIRWVPAIGPSSQILLEASASVVTESPGIAEVTIGLRGRLLGVHVAAGDPIEKGQPVLDVSVPELVAAAARWQSGRDQLRALDERLKHLRALQVDGLARADQLLDLSVRRSDLLAQQRSDAATLVGNGLELSNANEVANRGRITLHAPIAGVVTRVVARIGAAVDPGTVLAVVEGPKPARIEALLVGEPPKEGQVSFLSVDGRSFPLQLTPISEWTDSATGRKKVWFAPKEPVNLPSGLQGRIVYRFQDDTVEVPSAAIRTSSVAHEVFLLQDGKPILRKVSVLRDSGTSALIRGDLQAGQLVAGDATGGIDGQEPPP